VLVQSRVVEQRFVEQFAHVLELFIVQNDLIAFDIALQARAQMQPSVRVGERTIGRVQVALHLFEIVVEYVCDALSNGFEFACT